MINVTPVGSGVPINTGGLLVVDAGTSTAGAFTLGTTSATALIDFSLDQRGNDFFLVAAPNADAFQPLALSNFAKAMWYQSADIYESYATLRRGDLGKARTNGVGIWGQLYASRDRSGDDDTVAAFGADFDVDNRIRTHRRGAQVGVDFQPTNGSFIVGVTAGYQHADADVRSTSGEFEAKGYNIGAYAMFGSANGLYGGLLIKHDRNDVKLTNDAFAAADNNPDFTSTGVEGEAGYRFAMGGLNIDAGAGLAWVRSDIDGFTAEGITYDFDDAKSMRGRVGARVGFGGRWGPYLDGRLFHEFKDDSRLTLINGASLSEIETSGRGTWGRLEAGFGGHNGAGPMAAVWGEFGDVKGIGVKAGFRF